MNSSKAAVSNQSDPIIGTAKMNFAHQQDQRALDHADADIGRDLAEHELERASTGMARRFS